MEVLNFYPVIDRYRCTSTGRKCDGYGQNKAFQSHNSKHGFLPQYTVPTVTGFNDGIVYLEFYHRCAAPTLSSKFDNEFWSRTVLQMAQSEFAVRNALIALGYLLRTESGSLKHARSGLVAAQQRKTFLSHYNKSVRCLVDRIAVSSYVSEVVLVACLLFICIEFLRGNYHTAFTHLNSGLRLISDWQQREPASLQRGVSSNISASKGIVQDTLIPLYVRTIAPALLYGATVEDVFKIPCPHPSDLRGRHFTTIVEAETFSHELRNQSILFARKIGQKLFLRVPISTEDFIHQAELLECHYAWFRAMQDLESQGELSKEDQITASSLKVAYHSTYIVLACAAEFCQQKYDTYIENFKEINRHAKLVLNSMNLSPSTMSSPSSVSSTSSLNTRISASQNPTPSPHPTANFTFELSLIPCLHFVATRCRCPVTRREAVSLLALNPPREALWDAEQHALVATRCIEIEERELDPKTGWPVEKTRLWSAVIDGNMDRNGGFWVTFASAKWMEEMGAEWYEKERMANGGVSLTLVTWGHAKRSDAEWQEWFVL